MQVALVVETITSSSASF